MAVAKILKDLLQKGATKQKTKSVSSGVTKAFVPEPIEYASEKGVIIPFAKEEMKVQPKFPNTVLMPLPSGKKYTEYTPSEKYLYFKESDKIRKTANVPDPDLKLFYQAPEEYAKKMGYEYNSQTKTFESKDVDKNIGNMFTDYNKITKADLKEIALGVVPTVKDVGLGVGATSVNILKDLFLGTAIALTDEINLTEKNLAKLFKTDGDFENTPIRDALQDAYNYIGEIESDIASQIQNQDIATIAGGTGQILAMIAAGKRGGPKAVSTVLKSLIVADSAGIYQETFEATGDEKKSLLTAIPAGLISYGLNKIGFEAIMGKLWGQKALGKFALVVTGAFGESATETAEQFTAAKIQNISYGKIQPTLEDYFKTAWTSGAIGLIGSGVVGALDNKMMKAEKETLKELQNQGFAKNEARDILNNFNQFSAGYVKNIFNTINGGFKEASFKENREVGFKGLEEGDIRPGIEKAAPINDVTPVGFGPDEVGDIIESKVEKLKGETLDQAIARSVGYQIDNGVVKLEETIDGWKATVLIGEDPKVIKSFNKQSVLNDVYKFLNPGYVSVKKPLPETELQQSIQKAKASGMSFDEWVKGQGDDFANARVEAQSVSRDFNNKLAKARGEIKDSPTNPYYFEYEGKRANIIKFDDLVRYGGNKLWTIEVIDGGKKTIRKLQNDEVFKLSPLGKIMQKEGESGMIDTFVQDSKIEKLFNSIPSDLKQNIKDPGSLKTRSQLKAEWDAKGKLPREAEFSNREDIIDARKYVLTEANTERNLDELRNEKIPLNKDGTVNLYRGQDVKFGTGESFRPFSFFTTDQKFAKKVSNNVFTIKVDPSDLVITSKTDGGITFQNTLSLVKSGDKYSVEPARLPGTTLKTDRNIGIGGEKKLTPQELAARSVEISAKRVGGKSLESRAFSRLKAESPEVLEGELKYQAITLKEDLAKASTLLKKDKERAYRIAMGVESSKAVTQTSVNILMAEKALTDKNYWLYIQLTIVRSLANTRRGQEIVAEKASVSDNSTARYVKELLSARLNKLGDQYLTDLKLKKGESKIGRAMKIIDNEVERALKKINKSKALDIKEAQSIIDNLTCK